MSNHSFFNTIPPLLRDAGRIAAGGTLMLVATAAFAHDISMQIGIIGIAPSAAVALMLAGTALALIAPAPTHQEAQKLHLS